MCIFTVSPLPAIVTGAASVTDERAHWRVKAGDGAALEFTATQLRQCCSPRQLRMRAYLAVKLPAGATRADAC